MKFKAIIMVLVIILFGLTLLSFFSGSGGSYSSGVMIPIKGPNVTEDDYQPEDDYLTDITPTSLNVFYSADIKEGYIDTKNSNITYDNDVNAHCVSSITDGDSPFIALYPDDILEYHSIKNLTLLNENEGIILDLEIEFSDKVSTGYAPTFNIEFRGRSNDNSNIKFSEKVQVIGNYSDDETACFVCNEQTIKGFSCRITLVLRGFVITDSGLYVYRDLYMNGTKVCSGWFLVLENVTNFDEIGLVFSDVRLSYFDSNSNYSYIYVKNYSYSTFGNIDISGCIDSNGNLLSAPKSSNDAYILAFIKDRTIINSYK